MGDFNQKGDIHIAMDLQPNINMDKRRFQQMIFIMNALEKGWKVNKSGDSYVFTKKHENRREVFSEKYLENFIVSNMINTSFIA